MTTKHKPIMVELIDGSEASKTMVDIVFGCLHELSQTKQDALAELVKKCRDNNHKLWGPTLGQLVTINLVKTNGTSYDYMIPIVLTMMDGQTENFKPVHPAPDLE